MSNQLTEEARRRIAKRYDDGHEERLARLTREQRKLAAANHGTRKSMDVVGAPKYEMSMELKAAIKAGRSDAFKDPDYMRWLAKKNPELQIRSGKSKTMVGYGD